VPISRHKPLDQPPALFDALEQEQLVHLGDHLSQVERRQAELAYFPVYDEDGYQDSRGEWPVG
jgi:hypothetical protein